MLKHIKVYLSESEHHQLKIILKQDGLAMSAFIRKIIQEELMKRVNEWDEYHPFPHDPSVVWLIPKERCEDNYEDN